MRTSLPNIVFVIADDMGYGDVGAYNPDSKIPTPHLDRLAEQGLRFTDAHSASSVCTPSRYGVLTGRYCWRTRLERSVLFAYEPPLIEPSRLTAPSLLKHAGYHCACIGKWHLGLGFSAKPGAEVDFDTPLPWPSITPRELEEKIDFHAPLTGGPTELGFDYFFGTCGCTTAQPPYGFIENDRFIDPPSMYIGPETPELRQTVGRPGMAAAGWNSREADVVFAERAVEYIESRRDSPAPLFLYLATSSPHEPCKPEVVPDFAQGQSQAGSRGDMVWLVDWLVGQVIDALERTGRAENTLFLVTSDNGALPGDGRKRGTGQGVHDLYETYGHKSCGDWRGYKAHIWEGGHREPLLAHWPGSIPPGSVCEELVCLTDFMATFAALVGTRLPDNAGEDSVDLLPILLGDQGAGGPRSDLVHHSVTGAFSIRRGDWKCIFGTQGSGGWPPPPDELPDPQCPGQLYDITEDPGETTNLWDSRPDIVSGMRELLEGYQRSGRSAIPQA